MQASYVFKTRWGWMGIAATPGGIGKVVLPRASRRAVESELARVARRANGRLSSLPRTGSQADRKQGVKQHLEHARQQLVNFLAGSRRDVDVPMDLSGGSLFQRRVWLAARRIPFGRVRSYRWVAVRVGGRRYARAVGHALGANPIPIIVPCHRVVAHDGSLGGFSGCLRTKRRLLALEGTLRQLGGTVYKLKS